MAAPGHNRTPNRTAGRALWWLAAGLVLLLSALAALAGPIGALLPLLETGIGGESAYCDGLVERLNRAQQTAETP